MFIEAGTYVGNTAMRCSRAFDSIITMELDPDLHRLAKGYLAKRDNVLCLEGDALKLLPEVLDKPDIHDSLIFLDGHFSGGVTAHGEFAEPACEEISLVAKYKHKINKLIVDDFRCFGRDKGWPKRSRLLQDVEDSFGDEFDFAVHLDQVLVWRMKTR